MMSDLIIKLPLTEKERLLFSRLDMLVTPVSEKEMRELALAVDQAGAAFHYLRCYKDGPSPDEWKELRELCEQMREKMTFVQSVMGRSALVGRNDEDRGPLQ
jgi:hypothetical protein